MYKRRQVIMKDATLNRSVIVFFFFQAEDGIRDVERSRGRGDVYKDRTTRVSGARGSSHP